MAILYGSSVATLIFVGIMAFPETIATIFTSDAALIKETPKALLYVFLATPVITAQLVGSAYFQAAGKALPALILTLLKQGFFLIPLVYILPKFFGLQGVWYSFPVADILATIVTLIFLRLEVRKNLS